ncbi:sigma-70 family RNA polymerase sigma factor [Vibrio ponticus]|uniref:Sigma-70 family RNA polymerase sigma factor n=1 Tax=Vibrio ponticus TaxID=265668 RepID=A0A3N3DU86_9VIBR|nr:ECF-type sigma factor [Vibrio ponticus]ROV58002.1 sigma-70 family RNA polymerase sigma factor [Vibrio ponticus]
MGSALTTIIHQWQAGDKQAENKLYQFAYLQLRTIAQQERARSAQKYGHKNKVLMDSVNSTTALIHDAYLKLSHSEMLNIANHRDFYLMAARIMRQILIDNARTQLAQKRQIDQESPLEEKPLRGFEEILVVDEVLDSFSERYPRQSNAVKLKYLMGLKNEEISQLLECSSSLIEKDLKFSRSWLQARMV